MLSLKELISIEEVVPSQSVKGKTRQKMFPMDMFKIEDRHYRVNQMSVVGNVTEFSAERVSEVPYDWKYVNPHARENSMGLR